MRKNLDFVETEVRLFFEMAQKKTILKKLHRNAKIMKNRK